MISLPAFLLETPLPGLGRALTSPEAVITRNYLELLTKWQKVHRLIGSTEVAWMAHNVVADSLAFLAALPPTAESLADVGSGAGLPGVPIAIVRPEVRIVLIEARQRRISFLSTVVRELGLAHVEVVGSRVEDLEDLYAGRFDAAVSRCAGPAPELLPKVWPLVRPGGVIVTSVAASAPNTEGERLALRTPDGQTRWFQRYVKR